MSNENRLLTSVHTVTQLLSSAVNPDEALRLTLEAAVQAVDASGGSILLHDPERRQLWFHHVIGGDTQGPRLSAGFGLYGVAIRDDEGIAGQVFQTQRPQITNDAQENPQHAKRIDDEFQYETRNLITVPLRYPGGTLLGVMQLVNKRTGDFSEEDLTVLDIVASVSAMSAQNADLAAQAKKSKALDYMGRVVHDIANKVSRLHGPMEILRTAQEEALTRLNADESTLDDLCDRLSSIAEGVKDLERYTEFMAAAAQGKPIETRLEENNIIEVTERQLTLLDNEARGTHGVTIKREYDRSQAIVFPFDSFLLERAVFNLVNNALKATPKGGVVTVRIADEGDSVVLEVADTGHGMPSYVLGRILSGKGGSGAGLSTTIIREVAEVHGGRLEGESETGRGTRFLLRFPKQALLET